MSFQATVVQAPFNFFFYYIFFLSIGSVPLKAKINLLACKGGLKGCETLLQVHPSLHDVTSALKLANCQWVHNGSLLTQAHAHTQKRYLFAIYCLGRC